MLTGIVQANRMLRRHIGLTGAVLTLVGYVVGASIFVLPGELAAAAGPGVIVSYLLASIPAVFASVVGAQIGSALPVSGATYVAVSRTLGPFWGFLMVWTLLVAISVGLPLVAYGFADYAAPFLSPGGRRLVAVAAILAFGAVNLLPVRASVLLQGVMTAAFIPALVLFGTLALASSGVERLTPLFPQGLGPVLLAAVPAYFSYAGFLSIVELAEEIREPRRTIPFALAASFGVVLLVYLLVAAAVPAVLPWRELSRIPAPVARAAEVALPRALVPFVTGAALLAAATSLNAILLSQARDVFALARDRIFPAPLARIGTRSGIPRPAVLLVTLLAVAGTLPGAGIRNYAVMTVLGFMITQVLAGLALLSLPARLPAEFRSAGFRLGPFARWFFGLGLVLLSGGFLLFGAVQGPRASILFSLLVGAGALFYRQRREQLRRRGVSLEEALTGTRSTAGR